MDLFNWKNYLENYPDLKDFGIYNEQQARIHYNRYGKSEGRTDKYNATINNTYKNESSFGSILIYTVVCGYLAKCNNLKMTYYLKNEMESLGMEMYNGTETYDSNVVLTDDNVETNLSLIEKKNIIIHGTFEIPYIANFIKKQINKKKIMTSNLYKSRYLLNNDLFVHVRIDGIQNSNDFEPFEYYDLAISKLQFDFGYISSDCIKHPICTKLIRKFNLKIIKSDEVGIIQWASTCKWIVLSKSKLSWWIGLFAFCDSNVYYPERNNKNTKHVQLFVFKDWNKVKY
jgi:hypothetical protein